jgi:hypothetical protein
MNVLRFRSRAIRLTLAGLAVAILVGPTAASSATSQAAPLCRLRPGLALLPPGTQHGLIDHLHQYAAPGLATSKERAAARRLLAEARAAVRAYPTLAAATRAGYVTRTARSLGSGSVHYFHAERGERKGTRLLDPRRPKALIYANAPGRPLVIVGVMFSVRRGERGPSPGGPITRWHSHLVCMVGQRRGEAQRPDGSCPPGARLRQGSEMMHLWFTSDLRSAFAIRAPEPELCRDGVLPRSTCRNLDGLHGM